jgi:hypothetical protein
MSAENMTLLLALLQEHFPDRIGEGELEYFSIQCMIHILIL